MEAYISHAKIQSYVSVSEQKYLDFSQFNIKHHHWSVVDSIEKFKF